MKSSEEVCVAFTGGDEYKAGNKCILKTGKGAYNKTNKTKACGVVVMATMDVISLEEIYQENYFHWYFRGPVEE